MAIDTETPCSGDLLGVIGRLARTGQALRYSERDLTTNVFCRKRGWRNLLHWLAPLTLAFVSTTPSQAILGGAMRGFCTPFDGVVGLNEITTPVYWTGIFVGAKTKNGLSHELAPRLMYCRRSATKLADRREHFPSMPEQHADVFEILIGQMAKRRDINPILGKALRVLGHAERCEPVRNLLHRGPASGGVILA
jgi:hypothetical protein